MGGRCSLNDCRLHDFLPFKCDACRRIFCLEHRSASAHTCRSAAALDCKVFTCPLCLSSIKISGAGENVDFAGHERSGDCARAKATRAAELKIPTCGAPRCKKKLLTGAKVVCSLCRGEYCIEHRMPESHKCNPASAGGPGRSILSRFSSAATSALSAPAARPPTAAEQLRETAARRKGGAGVGAGAGARESADARAKSCAIS